MVSAVRISGTLIIFFLPLFAMSPLLSKFAFTVEMSGLVESNFVQGWWFIYQLPILIFMFEIPIVTVVLYMSANGVNSSIIIP